MNLQPSGNFQWCSSLGRRFLGLSLGASLVTLGSSALFSSGWALPTNTIAQVDPNTGATGVQTPYTAVTPVNGRVNIRFINETGAAIDYQVIGDTQYRSLPGRSEMTLENLRIPVTFTFRRADNGFLRVTFLPNSPKGTITVKVNETPDFAVDRTAIYVDQFGSVFLN